jgi:hypothetical protein
MGQVDQPSKAGTRYDIAVLTSGQVISEELGIKLEKATLEMLGRAKDMGARALMFAIFTSHWEDPLVDQDAPDPQFDAMTARLLRRDALRRAAEELNTTSRPGLEGALARISAEITAEAAYRKRATAAGETDQPNAEPHGA